MNNSSGGGEAKKTWLTLVSVLYRVHLPWQPPCWLHAKGDCAEPLRDPSGTELGEWLSRIIGWYTKGGFTDTRSGKAYRSDHHFKWSNYEVLNEPNLQRFLRATPNVPAYVRYTELYVRYPTFAQRR